jgi:hypothetical protein
VTEIPTDEIAAEPRAAATKLVPRLRGNQILGVIQEWEWGMAYARNENIPAAGIEVLAQVPGEKPEGPFLVFTPSNVIQELPEGALGDEDVVQGCHVGRRLTLDRLPSDAAGERLGYGDVDPLRPAAAPGGTHLMSPCLVFGCHFRNTALFVYLSVARRPPR